MASGSGIAGVQMAAPAGTAGVKGNAQTAKVDGGFQKLLDNKAQSDAGTKEPADSKVKDPAAQDTKDNKVTDTKEKPADKTTNAKEETAGSEKEVLDDGGLEQAQTQAALLFQLNPESYVQVEEAAPEIQVEGAADLLAGEMVNVAADAGIPAAAVTETVAPQELAADTETEVVEETAVPAVETLKEEPKAKAEKEKTFQEGDQRTAGQEANAANTQSTHVEEPRQRVSDEKVQIPMERVQVQEPEEIPDKVLNQLLAKMTEGIREFEIQLEPQDLGKILIKVAFGKEAANVSIVCTEQRTMDLMARNAKDIGAILSNNMGSPTTIVVEDKEPGYLEQHNQGNGQGHGDQNQEQQKEQQENKGQEKDSLDFLQQLRLGLV